MSGYAVVRGAPLIVVVAVVLQVSPVPEEGTWMAVVVGAASFGTTWYSTSLAVRILTVVGVSPAVVRDLSSERPQRCPDSSRIENDATMPA